MRILNWIYGHKTWATLLLAAFAILTVDAISFADHTPTAVKAAYQIQNEVGYAAVRVERPNDGGGSGTVVYQDEAIARILTCWHVVAGEGSIKVSWHNGMYHEEKRSDAKIISFDKTLDLALLECQPIFANFARVVTEKQFDKYVTVYQRVINMGHPATIFQQDAPESQFTNSPHLTEGFLSDLCDKGIRTSAPITFGCSGSGLFMMIEEHWTLIGVVRAVKTVDGDMSHPLSWVNYGVHPLHVMAFLKDYLY